MLGFSSDCRVIFFYYRCSSCDLNFDCRVYFFLTDTPVVVSILDGSTLKLILEDEDDFAMLAENLFTDLDEEDKGKLPKSQIRKALSLMGADMGVPPLSGFFFLLPFTVTILSKFMDLTILFGLMQNQPRK